jgi:hypothetical protein
MREFVLRRRSLYRELIYRINRPFVKYANAILIDDFFDKAKVAPTMYPAVMNAPAIARLKTKKWWRKRQERAQKLRNLFKGKAGGKSLSSEELRKLTLHFEKKREKKLKAKGYWFEDIWMTPSFLERRFNKKLEVKKVDWKKIILEKRANFFSKIVSKIQIRAFYESFVEKLKTFLVFFSITFWKTRFRERRKVQEEKMEAVRNLIGKGEKAYLKRLRKEEEERKKWELERIKALEEREKNIKKAEQARAERLRLKLEKEKAIEEENERRWGKKKK